MELKPYIWHISKFHRILLIVPYGIETRLQLMPQTASSTFNCTLWN